jgi:SAM-dependent methyltransferase
MRHVDGTAIARLRRMSTHSPDQIVTLGTAFFGSKALLSAVELDVFSTLAKETLDAETLRGRLGLHPRGARDFFDALVALGILDRDADGRYANTPDTDYFLDRAKPTYIGGLLEMVNTRLYPYWNGLADALRTGQPQNETTNGNGYPPGGRNHSQGAGVFDAIYADPERLRVFLQAMTGVSLPAAEAIARQFPWSNHRTFLDVGTAQGALPVQVAQAHPHLRGVGFDLPPVQPIFEEYVRSFGLADRLRFQPGDFFRDPLPHADVVVLGHVLHDWSLDEKRTLLAKASDALPPGGALVIYEALIDDERRQSVFGLLMSLSMLIETPGGFDFTGAEACAWLRDARFKTATVEPLVGWDSMIVATK